MKHKVAGICLAVGIVMFILGGGILGPAPEWFAVAAGFALAATILGVRWIRLAGALLVMLSLVTAILEHQGKQRFKERVREIQSRQPGVMP